jgi:hypothetical protein
MADILIDSVSASFTGTDNDDSFRNSQSNLRDITVRGLSGDDILGFGSSTQAGTSDGGVGLGYSIGSSTVEMGAGQDTLTFSGQVNSGASKFNSTQFRLGSEDDFALVVDLVSASGSVIKGNGGDDDITFRGVSAGTTAADFLLNGNAGADVINVSWTGAEVKSFRVLGGNDNDTISGSINVVSAAASAATGQSGLVFKGNKGDDVINLSVSGVSDAVKVNGNAGADTIVFTAANDISNLTIAGGKDSDVISAVFSNATSSQGVSVQGNVGNDTAAVTFNGGFVSGFTLGGGSGDDSLILNNNAGLSAGSANSIIAGTGADTITLNLGGNLQVNGASGFVADLGVAGASAVSGGTAGLRGGLIDINLSAAITGNAGAGIFFRGSNSDDVIDVNATTIGAIGLSNVAFSAESGADSITFATQTGGVYSAVSFAGGAGNDVFTAQVALGTNFSTTAGAVTFGGGLGDDTFVANVASAGTFTASVFDGGSGADSITINLQNGAGLATNVSGGTQFIVGSGADNIGINAATGAAVATILRAGVGDDLITGRFASGGVSNGLTADAGAGHDTISFIYSAAVSGGITMLGNLGGTINAGDGADSINVIANAVTGGTFNFGTILGGDGADTITFGGEFGSTAANIQSANFTGSINAGGGADSIIFSGNNVFSGGVGTFDGGNGGGSGGFRFASGDSVVGSFDTVFVSNNDVTGGQTNQAGTFGSAGFVFSSYNAAAFNMAVAAGTVANGGNTGGLTLGQAIYTGTGVNSAGGLNAGTVVLNNGFIGAVSGGSAGMAVGGGAAAGAVGSYVLTGGSTLDQIFSSVDATVTTRGNAAIFNVQNGSAGTIDGFLFVGGGGGAAATIVKFETNQLAAAFNGNGYFSAGVDAGISRASNTNSGGQIFFGQNVGVG